MIAYSEREHVQTSRNVLYLLYLWPWLYTWQCSVLSTSGFIDDVTFSHNTAYVVYGETYGRGMSVNGRQRREGRSFSAEAPPLSALPPAD